MDELSKIETTALTQLDAAETEDALEKIRVSVLGKKGLITNKMKSLSQMDIDERKSFGMKINKLKDKINRLIIEKGK